MPNWKRFTFTLAGTAGLILWLSHPAPADRPETIVLPPTGEEGSAPIEVTTDDPVLREQIVKIHEELSKLDQEMAHHRKLIQQEPVEANKAALYAELEQMQKTALELDKLLTELVWEARATEWTAIDEALKRVEPIERRRDYDIRREETTRDRQL